MLSFFFSSRRRHTRYWRDWSSDVCSSDLSLFKRHRLPLSPRLFPRCLVQLGTSGGEVGAVVVALGGPEANIESIQRRLGRSPQPGRADRSALPPSRSG